MTGIGHDFITSLESVGATTETTSKALFVTEELALPADPGRDRNRQGANRPRDTVAKPIRTGQTQHYNRLEELLEDPESFGSSAGRVFYETVNAEGLVSECGERLGA